MQITINKKTGRVSLKTGKFQYQHKITLGDIVIFILLFFWFMFDVFTYTLG